MADWEVAAREAFLDLQFRAQSQGWRARFPDSQHDVILLGDEPIGRVWVAWSDDECRVVDVTLLPQHRRRGVGGRILGEVVAEADERGVPVRSTVDRTNFASLGLHGKLGFEAVAADDVYVLMERAVTRDRPHRGCG